MAHNIATINGKAAIAYVGETPWHRLGTPVPAGISIDEALKAASLDWTVKALPAFAEINGKQTPIPVQAVIRETDGFVLGTVGPRWQPIQHIDAFKLFDPFVEAGKVRVDVLGALGNGATVWLLLKLAEEAQSIRTLKNGQPDLVLPYIKAALAHDGTRGLTIGDTGIRVVCANTLAASDAEGRADWVNIRHSSRNVAGQFDSLRKTIERAAERYRDTIEVYRKLAGVDITEAQLDEYVNEVLPLPEKPRSLVKAAAEGAVNIADKLLADAGIVNGEVVDAKLDEVIKTLELRYKTQVEAVEAQRTTAKVLAQTGAGNDGSSVWDAYNGITELVDHTARRDTEHAKKRAAFNAIAGEGAVIKGRALTLAKELVAA